MYNKKQQYDFVIINAPLPDDFALALPPMSHAETALWLC